jgi:1-acyl-sn-glycerol-3-phosphate acyltransferase
MRGQLPLAPTPICGGPVYSLGRWVIASWLRGAARARLEGREHIPATGPLLVAANHVSDLDPPLLAALFPRPLAFMGKAELFEPRWLGWLFAYAGVIPVRRGATERRSLDRALAVLARGQAVAVFPEGTRYASGVLGRAHPGVGLLAARSGAPVLPVAILGTERIVTIGDWLRRPRLIVRCGPLLPGEAAPRAGSAYYQRRADEIMLAIARLLPPRQRGVYAVTARTAGAVTLQDQEAVPEPQSTGRTRMDQHP